MRRISLALVLAVAACNTPMEGQNAPELSSGEWLDGHAPAAEWTVLSFFAPG